MTTEHWRRCGLAEGVLLLYVVFYRELILDSSTHLARGLVCDEHFCEVISVSLHMSVITQDGDSALMKAVREGRTKVVPLLLKAGANTDLQHKVCQFIHESTGMVYKACPTNPRPSTYLMTYIHIIFVVSHFTQDGDTPLMMATRWGRTEVVSLLLEAGANIHLQNMVCQCAYARKKKLELVTLPHTYTYMY